MVLATYPIFRGASARSRGDAEAGISRVKADGDCGLPTVAG